MSEPIRVLLADDDGFVRRFLVISLQRAGFQVTQCTSTAEARRLFQHDLFDVVVLDNDCPMKNSGREFAREVGSKTILISGLGVDDIDGIHFMQKPIIAKPLVDLIRQVAEATHA